jgi:hypothetical protein
LEVEIINFNNKSIESTESCTSTIPTTSTEAFSLSDLKQLEFKMMILTKLRQKHNLLNNKKQFFLSKTTSYPLNLCDYNRYSCINEHIDNVSEQSMLKTLSKYNSSTTSIYSTSQDADCEYDFDNQNQSNFRNELNKSKCDKCLDLLDEIEILNRKLEELSEKLEENKKMNKQENMMTEPTVPIFKIEPVKPKNSTNDSSKTKSVIQFFKKFNPFK